MFRSDTIRQSVSVPFDYTHDLAGIQAAVLLIHGRYNRMAPFEVSIAILNHIADWHLVLLNNSGNWPPFEKAGRVGPLTQLESSVVRRAASSAPPTTLLRRKRPFSGQREIGPGPPLGNR